MLCYHAGVMVQHDGVEPVQWLALGKSYTRFGMTVGQRTKTRPNDDPSPSYVLATAVDRGSPIRRDSGYDAIYFIKILCCMFGVALFLGIVLAPKPRPASHKRQHDTVRGMYSMAVGHSASDVAEQKSHSGVSN